jgi:transcription initiation factor TFIID subunit TAF12
MEFTQAAPAATADLPGEVAELRRQLDAMKAERDGAIDRAAKRYQQMVLAQSDSRNYLKAGRLEVAAKQALQAKFDNLMCLLGHRDSSIAELQTELANTKRDTNRDTECEVTAVFETCREQDKAEIAALKKQRDEDQKKILALETQLRIVRAVNEQSEKKVQQQAPQQLQQQQQQQQQLKRKLDDAMLQGEASGKDRTATGWRSPTAPPNASAPAVSTPDKRQRVGTPG